MPFCIVPTVNSIKKNPFLHTTAGLSSFVHQKFLFIFENVPLFWGSSTFLSTVMWLVGRDGRRRVTGRGLVADLNIYPRTKTTAEFL